MRHSAEIHKYINGQRESIVEHLRRLIAIDTHVPPGMNYDSVCQVMAERLAQYGCETSIHKATEGYIEASGARFLGLKGPRSNLVARYRGSGGGPILHLSAHVDTAPYTTEGWTHNPLEGELTASNPYGASPLDKGGGYVWGRGACDDKSMCTAMIYALEAVHELSIRLRGNLILTGNCDEEIGGVAGLGYLIKEGIVKADYGIQLDGDVYKMGLAAQGRTRYMIRMHGRAYHGQIPVLGVNAIEKMSKVNVALDQYWREVLLKRRMPVPGIALPDGLAEVGIDKLTAMLNIGTIRGGVQGATVPDLCEEEVLRGMIPGESVDEVTRELVEVIEGVKAVDPDLNYTLEVINSREGYTVDPTHPFIQRSRAIAVEVWGRDPVFSGNLASTDMNYQVNDGGVPCFTLGTGAPYTRYHQADESVCMDDVVTCAEILALIIVDTLGET